MLNLVRTGFPLTSPGVQRGMDWMSRMASMLRLSSGLLIILVSEMLPSALTTN